MKSEAPIDEVKLRRYREAGEWQLRLRESESSEKDVEHWLRWCEADGENLTAFEQLQRDWEDTEGFKKAPELLGARPEPRAESHPAAAPTPSQGFRWHHLTVPWAAAASIALFIVVGYPYWHRVPARAVVVTALKDPATLPDGSSLLLSAKATADIDFAGRDRRVALRPNGELYVKVHHDKARPFTVRAGTMTVIAVGTAFDVRRDADHVMVTVEEGTVLASAPGLNAPNEWQAGAGYRLDYSESTKIASISRVDTQNALRWRDGELAFDHVPLDEVVADINRYSTVKISVKGADAQRIRYTGTVFVASVDDWVRALETKYPVQADFTPDGEITLEARTNNRPAP